MMAFILLYGLITFVFLVVCPPLGCAMIFCGIVFIIGGIKALCTAPDPKIQRQVNSTDEDEAEEDATSLHRMADLEIAGKSELPSGFTLD